MPCLFLCGPRWTPMEHGGEGGESGHLGSLPPDGMLYTHIQDSNELASLYSEGLKNILDELAPSKAVVVTKRPQFSWFDNQSVQLKRAVRLLERRWRHHKSPDTWRDYSQLRNVYARHLWNNKRKIISKQVLDCQYNSKKLYTLVNNLTGRTGVNPRPQDGSDTSLPNRFADFFSLKNPKD